MIIHTKNKLEKENMRNINTIFRFVFQNIICYTTNYLTISFLSILGICGICFKNMLCIAIVIYWIMICFLVSIEETYHIGMLIHLNKKSTIRYLDVTCVKLGHFSLLGGASVCYTGKFSKSDLYYISLAGPVMSLLYLLCILVISVLVDLGLSLKLGVIDKTILLSGIAPIMSFIPINFNNYISDGYRIGNFIKFNKIMPYQIVKTLLYTIKAMIIITNKKL